MIAFLTLLYVGLLAILIKLKILPNTPGVWMSTLAWNLFLFVVLFIPMQWGAPSGPVRIQTFSVAIVPNINGQVTKVPIKPNTALKKDDVLFEISDTTFQAAVDATKAQLEFMELRLDQYKRLAASSAGTQFRVEETKAQVTRLKAELTAAEWNLDQTVVRAPTDGYVTYLSLRPGQRVTMLPLAPAMTFIDTSKRIVGTQIHQIYLRYLKIGQPAEIAFKSIPGRVFNAKIRAILEVSSQGLAPSSGIIPPAQQVLAEPFFVRLELEDDPQLAQLKPGMVGTAAIYTKNVAATHVIRKVMIRMESIINYLNPAL